MNKHIENVVNEIFSMGQFEYAEEFLDEEFLQKFAGLLIKECIDVIYAADFDNADYYCKLLEKHFEI